MENNPDMSKVVFKYIPLTWDDTMVEGVTDVSGSFGSRNARGRPACSVPADPRACQASIRDASSRWPDVLVWFCSFSLTTWITGVQGKKATLKPDPRLLNASLGSEPVTSAGWWPAGIWPRSKSEPHNEQAVSVSTAARSQQPASAPRIRARAARRRRHLAVG